MSYSDLLKSAQDGQVLDADILGAELRGHLKGSPDDQFYTTLPADHSNLIDAMVNSGVAVSINMPRMSLTRQCLTSGPVVFIVYPILLAIPAFWFIFRRAGIHPVFSIFVAVPVVNLITLYVVAFSKESIRPVRRF
jgi:ATP-dependent Zn protease